MAHYQWNPAALSTAMQKAGFASVDKDGNWRYDDFRLAARVRDLTQTKCSETSIRSYRIDGKKVQRPNFVTGCALALALGVAESYLLRRVEEQAAA